jgi:predicted ArsR family transcriptional regulator
MDFFDERILAALKEGKPRGFSALLSEVGFSHNTLQQHLERLTAKGLVVREKVSGNGFGRPKFAYHVPSRAAKQINAALEDPQVELVAIAFSHLRHVCRFEKGDHYKETKKDCTLKFAPQITNKNYDHFTPIKGTSQRAWLFQN